MGSKESLVVTKRKTYQIVREKTNRLKMIVIGNDNIRVGNRSTEASAELSRGAYDEVLVIAIIDIVHSELGKHEVRPYEY